LQNDLETLQVVESSARSNPSIIHRDVVAARPSPFGLANRYGTTPFTFPVSVQLEDLGALAGVLVCWQRRDKSSVVSEKKLLLTGTSTEVDSYLGKWHMVAVNRACSAFELVKEAAMERFGDKSSFYRKMNGLSPADSNGDPDPCRR
jgi:hypothetical protein